MGNPAVAASYAVTLGRRSSTRSNNTNSVHSDIDADGESSTGLGRGHARRPSSLGTTVTPSVELPSSPGLGRRRRSLASATASEHHLSPPGSSGSASHADGQTLDGGDLQQQRPAKARKVSRACDFCKSRKAKCSGNQPCSKCVSKGRHCLYNAKYTRGRPPTPPPSVSFLQPDGLMDTAVAPGSSAGTAMSASASAPAAVSTGLAPSRQQHQHQRQHQGDHMLQHNTNISTNIHPSSQDDLEEPASQFGRFSSTHQSSAPSRASPELGMAEIQGQVFDPTSGLTFLHRAWKRLAAQDAHSIPDVAKTTAEIQPVTMAGDRPLPDTDPTKRLQLPSPDETRDLLKLYFDVCIATYRFLYRPAAVRWLGVVERNLAEGLPLHHEIGHARAAIILTALAIATSHNAKSKGFLSAADEARALAQSDELFCVGARLVEGEVGIPKLESAQVRLVQVLYCLTTCRFNKSWYIFGNALSLISTLGLHRLENSKRRRGGVSKTDYIHTQCKRRTFWTAYILDNYLGVMLGRPRHFHDDDIDQELPDPVNDEDMTALGPLQSPGNPDDCHIDALIYHAKIARITASISRDIYAIKGTTEEQRITAAHRLIQRVNEWQSTLPLHLGSIRLSMLIPSYRRQATVLKLAYAHAVMHASRLFLLGSSPSIPASSPSAEYQSHHVEDCIAAAKGVLETVDYMAREGSLFHAFWWTHYVTFTALVVIYVWEIQQQRLGRPVSAAGSDHRGKLLELAERCHVHLARATATNSPSRRYAVILDEFRTTARSQPSRNDGEVSFQRSAGGNSQSNNQMASEAPGEEQQLQFPETLSGVPSAAETTTNPHLLDEWQMTDWLELDSSAFWTHVDFDESLVWPGIG